MKKQTLAYLFAFLLFLIGFFVMLQQYIVWGTWWSWTDFIHHENITAIFVSVGLGFLAGHHVKRK